MSEQFDSAKPVPGELNYLGYESATPSFSLDDFIKGLRSLDGEDRCGLYFRLGEELTDHEIRALGPDNSQPTDARPIKITGDTFCVGGGAASGYICHIYTKNGPVWLSTHHGSPDDTYEIAYDSGCDTELGIFPGNYVVPYADVVEAAREFFCTGDMTSKLTWVPHNELGFDPWCFE